eukprot:TRINITY_DN2227_c0_g3_i1.p1 TRINITY_DN2227_c0_g3~~TRINITY_DN2227_c0_g3_i1.p1  ORF type:complete len:303 (+),score=67.17 TRINITY_DN2227_c0_g3_i1:597-1505(+)
MASVSIQLIRQNKTFVPGSIVEGNIIIVSESSRKHSGIRVNIDGNVERKVVENSSYGPLKPIMILEQKQDLVAPGQIPEGTTSYPFEFLLEGSLADSTLYESYTGWLIEVVYTISVTVGGTVFNKTLEDSIPFYVNIYSSRRKNNIQKFVITPDSFDEKIMARSTSNEFKIVGQWNQTSLDLNNPFSGYLIVEHSDYPIVSIDLSLSRIETLGDQKISHKNPQSSLIQTIQIGNGDIARGLKVPIHMIIPENHACISTFAPWFSVQFEVILLVVFSICGEKYGVCEQLKVPFYRTNPSDNSF